MGTVHAKTIPQDINNENKNVFVIDKTPFIVPVRVDKVHINGLGRTKDDIVKESVEELFRAQDFQEVFTKAIDVRTKLDSLGCFRNIGVFIDTSSGPDATSNGLEITFHVQEFKRIVGAVNTSVGNNEGSLVIGAKMPNMFGRGERLQSEFSYGLKKTNNFNMQFVKPLMGKHKKEFSASVYQSLTEWPWSGYKEIDRGLLLDFGFNSMFNLRHNIQWDAAIRDLGVLSRTTSFAVREQSGLSLKSSIRHILSLDLRNEPIFPQSGTLLKLTSELAGIGGDIGFVKNELSAQINIPLLEDVVFQIGTQIGALHTVNQDKKVTLTDQYFLGGPLNLRGFQTRGIGPHTDGNALGSDIYWATAFHLYTPLPFTNQKGGFSGFFRTHFFVNAGNVANINNENVKDLQNELLTDIRIAYGLGIAARLGQSAKIELNYCFPYQYKRGDQLQPGVQFGIGLEFL